VDVPETLPRITPAALRDVDRRCPRRVALDFEDCGVSDPIPRARVRDAFLEATRALHASGRAPSLDGLRVPAELEPEEQRVFEQAARWYVTLYGDRAVTLHLHDCERPTERAGVRVGGWVDLTVVHRDGTKELRQLELWRGRRPRADPLELERVWLAVLRLRPWVGDGRLLVSWADLVDGARREREVDLGVELDGLRRQFDEHLELLRGRADPTRPAPGADCGWCRHIARCPAHPGALPVVSRRHDLRPGILRITPTSYERWRRCPRAWWLANVLSVPESDVSGAPDHGQLLHDVMRFVHEHGSCHDASYVDTVVDDHGGSERLRDEITRHSQRCPSPAVALGHEQELARFGPARPALRSFLVTARLDAIWVHDGLLDARDYKTGGVVTSRVADDPRAWLQAWVLAPEAERRGLSLRLRYEHLAAEIDEEPDPWEPDPDELRVVEERIRADVVAMRDDVAHSGVADTATCGRCMHRSICRDSAAPGEPAWALVDA
jgi:hypothetical protein